MDLQSLVNDNQSIKIVPSIEDIVRQNGFDTNLNQDMQLWLTRLKGTWNTWKKSAAVQHQLHEMFNSIPDPFSLVLVIIMKCPDFKDCKPKTLPYCIVEELYAWRVRCNRVPDNNIKLTAFHIATQQRNQDFLNLIVKTYHIQSEKISVLPLVQDMIKQGIYKQALQSVISMEMYNDIPVEDVLFPLVLQDKGSMVDNYLEKCPHQVEPFILYVDKLLDRSISLKDTLVNYINEHDIIDVKWDKLYHKPLGKLVARLCSKFKIPIKNCKNLSKNRTTGGLRYLIGQKYLEKSVSDTAWNDLVKDSLDQNPEAAEEFIDLLCDHEPKEALKWAEYLKIPMEKYPHVLTQTQTGNSDIASNIAIEEENWDVEPGPSQEFYKLSIKNDQICIIDSPEQFYCFMNSTLKDINFVGIDCEWKPSFGATQSRVALIQVATCHNVYLIDTIVLNKQEFVNVWHMFLETLLDNAEIIKVGFGLDHDLREMKSTLMGLGSLKMKGEGFLDLAVLWRCLSSAGIQFPYNSESGGASLSCLAQSCFGLPLMKHEQCSNWEIRPLRKTQIEYAALDAFVLVEIYRCLQHLCRTQNIKFDDICYDVMIDGKQKNFKKNKALKKAQQSINAIELNKPVEEVKFLVDPSLSNLLLYLRFCGIDTAPIPGTMLWHNVVNLAISEERCILLSKIKHTPTENYSQDNIFEVRLAEAKVQFLKIIQHFKIRITPENLFRRCVLCNGIDLDSIPYKEVQNMHTAYKEQIHSKVTNICADDLYLDNFLSDPESDEELYQPAPQSTVHSNSWLTKTGASIKIEEASDLPKDKDESITLCHTCGKLYWSGNHPIQDVGELIKVLPLC